MDLKKHPVKYQLYLPIKKHTKSRYPLCASGWFCWCELRSERTVAHAYFITLHCTETLRSVQA